MIDDNISDDKPQETEQVQVSNTSIVRDPDGRVSLWVAGEKIIGVQSATLQPQPDGVGMWVVLIPSNRVRMCERVPAPPVYENTDNVVPFVQKSGFSVPRPKSPTDAA